MTMKSSVLGALSILGHVATSQAACSREVLAATKDIFLSNSISKLNVASTAKIAENNILVKSIKDTVYGAATARASPFEIFVLDEAACTVGLMTVLSAPKPLLTSLRVQVSQGGEVTEVEILKSAGKGAGAKDGGVPTTVLKQSALWAAPASAGANAAPSRDSLVKILDTYPSGIQGRSGKGVPSTPDCARMENGMKMPFKCNQAFEGLGFPVTNRTFYADTKTGVSLAKFYFDQRAMPLWLHEYMKITDGKITEIQAVYLNYKGTFKDVLASKKNVKQLMT